MIHLIHTARRTEQQSWWMGQSAAVSQSSKEPRLRTLRLNRAARMPKKLALTCRPVVTNAAARLPWIAVHFWLVAWLPAAASIHQMLHEGQQVVDSYCVYPPLPSPPLPSLCLGHHWQLVLLIEMFFMGRLTWSWVSQSVMTPKRALSLSLSRSLPLSLT